MNTTDIIPEALYWASFNRFEFRIPGQAIIDICHSGPNDSDVAAWLDKVLQQVEMDNFPRKPTLGKIREELDEYGAWDDTELLDETMNWQRLLWLAAWDIFESDEPDCSEPFKS